MARPLPPLFLHAGHPKTGTSALQCAFARSIPRLAAHGIHYPAPPDLKAVQAGAVSSGNIHAPRLAERYHAAAPRVAPDGRLLFSTEAAFRVLPTDPAPLEALLAEGVPVEIVLYLRDPVTQVRSVYAQMVERRGYQGNFDSFLEGSRFLDAVERFLDLCTRLQVPVWAWNYSADPGAALAVMEDILGVPAGTLDPLPGSRVNRSLTRAEIRALQEIAARHGPGAAAAAGRALCERLPDVLPDPPQASAAAYGAFTRRVAPQVARLNARLPEEARLRIEAYEEVFGRAPAGPAVLGPDQRAVLAAAVGDWSPAAADPLRVRAVRALDARAPGLARSLRFVRDRLRG
ncbi:hypothetical protein [Roseicyclus persicicus]|uniref:Uncharacterized protein n=1 Tax=Roseicyclus persicicus TaxID=2650661 RepID=A0A7X6GX69_9RHOB|nr:hypothetical protein [Roseibacterium persicicum]NKX44034.1 hypothetical protein [Roseibacterium persicicum]